MLMFVRLHAQVSVALLQGFCLMGWLTILVVATL